MRLASVLVSSRLRYGTVALAAFMLGSATIVTAAAIPVTRIVDRFDANKAAAVDENGKVSVDAANTDGRLDTANALLGGIKTDADKLTFDASGNLKTSSSGTTSVSGSVSVNNFPATQAVSGSVSVNNLPATQPVSGTVNVGNFPTTQTVHVDNFPASSAPGVANRGLFIGSTIGRTNSGTVTTVPVHMSITYMEVAGCDAQTFWLTGGGSFTVFGSGTFTFPGGLSVDHVTVSYNSILGGSCDPFTQIVGF